MAVKIEVEVSKGAIDYKDKVTGKEKSIECVTLKFPNGGEIKVFSTRFNYKAYDYLIEKTASK